MNEDQIDQATNALELVTAFLGQDQGAFDTAVQRLSPEEARGVISVLCAWSAAGFSALASETGVTIQQFLQGYALHVATIPHHPTGD